jgi:dihydrofolate synthase/folylpolyglutamate synthase
MLDLIPLKFIGEFYHVKRVAFFPSWGYNPTAMDIEQAYQETLNYLYGFVDYSLTKADRLAQAKFELSRMFALLEQLGNPHQAYPIIHVTGTKGKGSVTAMCSHILRAAGYRTGMYTSPHLDDYAERIQVNGTNIPHSTLVELVEEMKPAIQKVEGLTTFEITTALALLYFSRQRVDAAVLEVGLGGRLDATNVVTPVVSVITSISYDHMFVLGNTLGEIAGEKAGIIKPRIPVVCAPQEEEALRAIQNKAQQCVADLYLVGRDYQAEAVIQSLEGQTIKLVYHPLANNNGEVAFEVKSNLEISLPLLGQHQVENAAVAFAAIDIFRQRALPISDRDIRFGFARTFWPGRFEVLSGTVPVILDCAHNRESIHELVRTIQEYFPGMRCFLIFGASEDKDIAGMFDEIFPVTDIMVATKSFHPRACPPERLIAMASKTGVKTKIVANVTGALQFAIQNLNPDQVILVTGSIFVVAEARHAWFNDDWFQSHLNLGSQSGENH